jgi:hypothetical protein
MDVAGQSSGGNFTYVKLGAVDAGRPPIKSKQLAFRYVPLSMSWTALKAHLQAQRLI